jgi:hypothetical protein
MFVGQEQIPPMPQSIVLKIIVSEKSRQNIARNFGLYCSQIKYL